MKFVQIFIQLQHHKFVSVRQMADYRGSENQGFVRFHVNLSLEYNQTYFRKKIKNGKPCVWRLAQGNTASE